MANPFYVQPAIATNQALQGLGGLAQAGGQYLANDRAQDQNIQSTQQFMTLVGQANTTQDPEQKKQLMIQAFTQFPEQAKQLRQQSAYAKEQQDLANAEKEKTLPYQQGTGNMAGYAFNPNDGSFKLDPAISEALQMKAAEKAAEGAMLSAKDRQGINKDVTSLIANTVEISKTAKDLDKLGKLGGGPASIALIFKFMKALDPQSVVRESEFATAENSSGVPEGVRNMYNKLMNGEKLGETQISEFIATSKLLADSSIESSTGEVNSYLDTYEDTIPESFKNSLIKRLPASTAKKQPPKAPVKWSDF